ncbi:MAG: response regulator [Lachnospiraceae bacterium]|nr:response regulator [Lachnospiraceae bacterium]
MKSKLGNISWRRGVWIGFFVVLLVLIGLLLEKRLEVLLNANVEEHVARQAATFAESVNNNFENKLDELAWIAEGLQQDEGKIQAVLDFASQDAQNGYTMGVLALGGGAVYGDELDFQMFPAIQEAFRGNPAVCYDKERGLLFTVPIFSNSNVKYVLYRLYDVSVLAQEFGISGYEDAGVAIVVDREGVVISSMGWSEEIQHQLWDEDRAEEFAKIDEKMNIAVSAAVYEEYAGEENFLFVAEVGDTGMYLVGFVNREVFADGILGVKNLVLWVFALLALFFTISLAYMFSAEEKIRESNKLRQEKEMAEQASRFKSEFLARMSHEIRTPINTVIGMNEMVLRECKDEEIRDYANNSAIASRNLLSLINDILDFSKIESGRMQIVEGEYELGNVLRNAAKMIQFRANQKNLQFDVVVDESLPYKLYGDENRIQQILLNLLSNAVKYTRTGGLVLEVKGQKIAEKELELEFSVTDTGIGIKEEDRKHLFQDFERLNMDENRNIEGTGLGLAISYRLAKQMKGELTVVSEYGKGSTFTLRLPQYIIKEESIANYTARYDYKEVSAKSDEGRFVAPTARILAVDDNEMNLLVVRSLLKRVQVQVTCCISGTECLHEIQNNSFDVVLLDHMMPGMDGIETLKELRKMPAGKEIPVIALTANAIAGVREEYLAAGFDGYLSKPIDAKDLEEVLLKYLPQEKCIITDNGDKAEEQCRGEKKMHTEEKGERCLCPEMGIQYCGEAESVYREVLQMFCDMKEDKKGKIQESFAGEDWKNYTIYVHALKSTSLSIGGKMLSKQAADVEKAGKQGDIAYIKKMHETLMGLYDQTVEEAKQYLSGTPEN